MLTLKTIAQEELPQFRIHLEAYWQELMPHADVIKDVASRNRYFQERFVEGGFELYVALEGTKQVGLLAVAVDDAKQSAVIEDFYVFPQSRRRGYGRAMVAALYERLDLRNITQVELSVRRDNPQALAFWEAIGFRIGAYRMRQYRDPKTGKSFIGALSSDFLFDC
ncbi:MAG: GNAT family N-acetyltransferase [Caldilineaceae bacterium]